MSTPETFVEIEADLKLAGISVSQFLRDVEVNPSNWYRWRSGPIRPRVGTWERIEAEWRRVKARIEKGKG